MTPKEKALELVNQFRNFANGTDPETDRFSPNICKEQSKQCALIAVDEIFKVYELLDEDADIMFKTEINYWQEVKQEIEKL